MDGVKSRKTGTSTNFASFVEEVQASKVKYGDWQNYTREHKWYSTIGATMRSWSQGDVLISVSDQIQWDQDLLDAC